MQVKACYEAQAPPEGTRKSDGWVGDGGPVSAPVAASATLEPVQAFSGAGRDKPHNGVVSLKPVALSGATRLGGAPAKAAAPVPQDARAAFRQFNTSNTNLLSKEELFEGFKGHDLNLTPEMYRQYIDCNFVYADQDGDGKLCFDEYYVIHSMIQEVRRKFDRFDRDRDGLITKQDFTKIVHELHLKLDEKMCRHYVDMNFRYVDRSFRGTITFGQFLACYANFLQSHVMMQQHGAKTNTRMQGGLEIEDFDDATAGPLR